MKGTNSMRGRDNAYKYTDAKDYVIEDVFHIVNSQLPGHQYLEKASKVLRLQASLLLLNDDLPVNPNLLMLLTDQNDGDRIFKVTDEDSWEKFIAVLTKILIMDDASVFQRINLKLH